MSTDQLIEIVQRRGLILKLVDGQPVITRPGGKGELTDNLLKVLKHHRERIIERLSR